MAVAVALVGVALGTGLRLAFLRPSQAASFRVSLAAYAANGDLRAALSHQPGFRVLFVGNSLTAVNDLPALVAGLASGTRGIPRPFLSVGWTPPGETLAEDLRDSAFRRLLHATRWNLIVLQEGTPLSAVFDLEPTQMEADVATLSADARRIGAVPLLFETWGNRTGTDPEPYDYEQSALAENYANVGVENHVDVAPAGTAWGQAAEDYPSLELWEPDGHHPALPGSYLAAATITACISAAIEHDPTITDPIGNDDRGGLGPILASELRRIAWRVVGDTRCQAYRLAPDR